MAGKIGLKLTVVTAALVLASCQTFDSRTVKLNELKARALEAYTKEDMEKAERSYRKALQIDKADFEVLFRLGNVYARTNRIDEAITKYEETIELKPNFAPVWRNLAVLRLRQGMAALMKSQQLLKLEDPLFESNQAMIDVVSKGLNSGSSAGDGG